MAAGGVLLLGGRLGDLLGRRRMLESGTALFAAASLTAGIAQDAATLVASRFAQGLGVALAAPAALSLVAVLFPGGRNRARALGCGAGWARRDLVVWAAAMPRPAHACWYKPSTQANSTNVSVVPAG